MTSEPFARSFPLMMAAIDVAGLAILHVSAMGFASRSLSIPYFVGDVKTRLTDRMLSAPATCSELSCTSVPPIDVEHLHPRQIASNGIALFTAARARAISNARSASSAARGASESPVSTDRHRRPVSMIRRRAQELLRGFEPTATSMGSRPRGARTRGSPPLAILSDRESAPCVSVLHSGLNGNAH